MRLFSLFNRADQWTSSHTRRPHVSAEPLRQYQRPARITLTAVVGAVLVFIVFWVVFWFFFIGPYTRLSNPLLRGAVPTAVPTPIERIRTNPWENHDWLSQEEARGLRQKQNVVNLALLENGGVRYSDAYSVSFQERIPWQRAKPFRISALEALGTTVEVTSRNTYHLNVYQPFVFGDEPNVVYLVDGKGQLWESALANLALIPVETVPLPVIVAPNPKLTFTVGERR